MCYGAAYLNKAWLGFSGWGAGKQHRRFVNGYGTDGSYGGNLGGVRFGEYELCGVGLDFGCGWLLDRASGARHILYKS